MSQSGEGRACRGRRPSSCRAWADGLSDEAVAEVRRRVEEDALVDVALLFAHAAEWQDAACPAHDAVEEPAP